MLETEIPLRERFGSAFGVKPSASPEYATVLRELLGEPLGIQGGSGWPIHRHCPITIAREAS